MPTHRTTREPAGAVASIDPRLYIKRRALQTTEHFRDATCEEVGCAHYLFGWVTVLPVDSEHLAFIRTSPGREFTEHRNGPGLIEFHFKAGQRCFRASQHKIQNGRPPTLLVQRKDRIAVEQEPERWVGEYNEETARAHAEYKQGSYT